MSPCSHGVTARPKSQGVDDLQRSFDDFDRRVRENYRLMFNQEMPAPSPLRDRFQKWLTQAGVFVPPGEPTVR